jgi:hypothetical protein
VAGIVITKLLLNSVISTPGARFMTADIKDFYLNTDLAEYEYVTIPLTLLPQAAIDKYELADIIIDGHVYAKVRKGIYGLPHAGKIANDELQAFLKPHGYAPCAITHGLWKHEHSDLMFTLVVDDFGIRYTNCADADNLMQLLKQKYKISEDWTGARYIGLTLDWDYFNHTVNISMPGHIERMLQRFHHQAPAKPEDSPHQWTAPNYESRQQYTSQDDTPALDAADKLRI